jgi:peptidoglycan-associated lipoprotein
MPAWGRIRGQPELAAERAETYCWLARQGRKAGSREETALMRNWRNFCGVNVLLIVALALVGGCGKKPKVATEAAPPGTTQTQIVPETPSASNQPVPASGVDYANLDPSEYGMEDVFFPYDAYALSDAAMAALEKNARIMQEHASISYLVEGHCDERGTIEYNLALGEKRAKIARDYLMSLGIPASRLRLVSYGEERPFADGSDESAWALNRRAHFARP